jgi:nucleoside-diphosphate-sugar epimerase
VNKSGTKNRKTQISILGCGWLGLPLAKALLEEGFIIHGSTTSEEKLPQLEKSGILPFLLRLDSQGISDSVVPFLKGSQTLIIDIPPKLRGNNPDPSVPVRKEFVEKIQTLIPFIEKSTVENVLFVSSTSVYGETHEIITEETLPRPDTESGKQLLQAEQLLQSNINFKTTVLRFGGLIGEDRHPVKFLAGKENLENPDAPINMIHQQDCIGLIQKIIALGIWKETFNAVTPFHPSRKEYYTQKAIDLGLQLPHFSMAKPSMKKFITHTKLERVLNYTFVKTNL